MVESALSQQKVFHTALCVMPPIELCDQIQEIRKQYDGAFKRWPPHINLLFPFIPPEEFEIGKAKLQKQLEGFQPFTVSFDELGSFQHAKKCKLWAKPETTANQFGYLMKEILQVLPFCEDTSREFTPHLSLGDFSTNNFEQVKKKFDDQWKKFEFKVDQIYMIQRDGKDDPMYVKEIIKLGQ